MQDGLFFRILRRVNLVMFTLLWIGLLTVGGVVLWKHGLPPKSLLAPDTHYTPPALTPAYSLLPEAFGGDPTYTPIKAPSIYVYSRSMISADSLMSSYGGLGASQAINLMVIDDKGEGHWLFKTNKQQIVYRVAVHKGALTAALPQGSTDVRPVIGLVMEVADDSPAKLTNDAAAVAAKPVSVYLWKQGATEAVKLLDKVYVENSEQISADRFHIVYSNGKEDRVAVYSVPEFEKLSDKALPNAPQ